jgi:hypothetical protein
VFNMNTLRRPEFVAKLGAAICYVPSHLRPTVHPAQPHRDVRREEHERLSGCSRGAGSSVRHIRPRARSYRTRELGHQGRHQLAR